MRSSGVVRASDCQCESRKVLGSIQASSDTVKSEWRQMMQCCIKYTKILKAIKTIENIRTVKSYNLGHTGMVANIHKIAPVPTIDAF
jgi:hypothetical protein